MSEADLKKAMTGSAVDRVRSSLNKDWDSGSDYSDGGVVKDFKGELSSQLDGISSSSLDLKDPATPKRSTFESDPTSTLADARGRLQERAQRPQLRMTSSSPVPSTTPALTIDTAVNFEDPIVPPRLSSLTTPLKTPNTVGPVETIRKNSVKFGPRPHRSGSLTAQSAVSGPPSTVRDTSRLRVQHRSIASASEPSLIPPRDDDNSNGRDPKRSVRLVPSSASVGWSEAGSPALSTSMSSQTDLTEETGNGRSKSSSAAPSREDSLDIESRAKEFAVKCWTEDDEFLAKEKIAEWLGGKCVSDMSRSHHLHITFSYHY